MRFVVLASLVLLLSALPAQAQEQYDAGIFFDSAGTQTQATVQSHTPFYLYLVAFDLDGEVFRYEGHLTSSHGWIPKDPGGVAILACNLAGPNPYSVGNFIVNAGGCIPDVPGPMVLVEWLMGYFFHPVATDMTFCLVEVDPTNFSPPAPGYMSCAGDLIPFGTVPSPYPGVDESCAVANPTAVSSNPTSVGAVKARF